MQIPSDQAERGLGRIPCIYHALRGFHASLRWLLGHESGNYCENRETV